MYQRGKKFRVLGKILFVFYIGFMIYFLIFSEWYGRTGVMKDYRYNLMLFKEIRRFWIYREQLGAYAVFTNLFGNVLIFIPFGFFLPMASKYRSFLTAVAYSFVLSLCVEAFQLLARVGSFDVDDMLLNTLGGAFGYMIFVLCAAIRRRHGVKRTERNSQ